jgi:hypothetical protein
VFKIDLTNDGNVSSQNTKTEEPTGNTASEPGMDQIPDLILSVFRPVTLCRFNTKIPIFELQNFKEPPDTALLHLSRIEQIALSREKDEAKLTVSHG